MEEPDSRIPHEAMFEQKVAYIHNNLVAEGLAALPEHYAWSSAHTENPLRMFERGCGNGWRPVQRMALGVTRGWGEPSAGAGTLRTNFATDHTTIRTNTQQPWP